ncbi:hypothetical protein [Saccharothrix violaceirubra]|uniref:Uncharacterized protein n=1 Tax=Saccharothrix violaceirubra TaxID=413306 RepID=A0A7W7T4F8_9PSEU|nr:hypothetical protein [Saccharothrix violaceirubra]MBB4966131.1 hypothetical protein [Saccharothrix violaceirubra]
MSVPPTAVDKPLPARSAEAVLLLPIIKRLRARGWWCPRIPPAPGRGHLDRYLG